MNPWRALELSRIFALNSLGTPTTNYEYGQQQRELLSNVLAYQQRALAQRGSRRSTQGKLSEILFSIYKNSENSSSTSVSTDSENNKDSLPLIPLCLPLPPPDHLIEESKRRRTRTNFTQLQITELEKAFRFDFY